jgi:hypothetical protein
MDQNTPTSSSLEWELSLSTAIADNYSSFISPPPGQDQNSIIAAWMKDPHYNIFDTRSQPLQSQVNVVRQYVVRLINNWKVECKRRLTTFIYNTPFSIHDSKIQDEVYRLLAPTLQPYHELEIRQKIVDERTEERDRLSVIFADRNNQPYDELRERTVIPKVEWENHDDDESDYDNEQDGMEGSNATSSETIGDTINPPTTGGTDQEFDIEGFLNYLATKDLPPGVLMSYSPAVYAELEQLRQQGYESGLYAVQNSTVSGVSCAETDMGEVELPFNEALSTDVLTTNTDPTGNINSDFEIDHPEDYAQELDTVETTTIDHVSCPEPDMSISVAQPDIDPSQDPWAWVEALHTELEKNPESFNRHQPSGADFEKLDHNEPLDAVQTSTTGDISCPYTDKMSPEAFEAFKTELAQNQVLVEDSIPTDKKVDEWNRMNQMKGQDADAASNLNGEATPEWLKDVSADFALKTDADGIIICEDFDAAHFKPAEYIPIEKNFPVDLDASANSFKSDTPSSYHEPSYNFNNNSHGSYVPGLNSAILKGTEYCVDPAQNYGIDPTACGK